MNEEWPKKAKPQKESVSYNNREERDDYIKVLSGNCWWIKKYLDSTLPHAQ